LAGFVDATDITVAVIDTGVDSEHPDLEGVISEEQNFTSGPAEDTEGHGTHVIGIIAALRDNAIGIAGACQSRKIMSLKALGPYDGPGYYRAIKHATDNGAKVINLSLGGEYDATEELLIGRAIEEGVVVVAAMGNEFRAGNPTSYPAAIDGVIAVGATTKSDARAKFSNTGRHITIVAPGVDILSTIPTYPCTLSSATEYDSWDGTSMATPFVAAAAALILANSPEATVDDVRRALVRGADRIGSRRFSENFGYGRLNIWRSLKKL
jgi:subtilisin family serine protease